MKKLLLIITIAAISIVGTTTVLNADADKGQKLYKKKLRKSCGFSGVRLARSHSQDEWREIYDSGKFPDEIKKICPRVKLDQIKKDWWPDIYDFAYKYAADSSHVPNC
ncbi:MAG: hypothetical protein U9R27_09840 [Campylobacterota bacterium]|nr:hypothetical protein [Campylobacterota bacterium]